MNGLQSTVFQKQSSTYLNDLYGTHLDETFEITIHITLQTKQDNSEQNWTKQDKKGYLSQFISIYVEARQNSSKQDNFDENYILSVNYVHTYVHTNNIPTPTTEG